MENNVLVTTTTFPRWKDDATPRFVYELSEKLAAKYKVIVLAPHHKEALKKEKLGKVDVRRFAYFKPESLQKLCYNGGIIPNMESSFLAKMQMPLLVMAEFFAASKIIKKEKIRVIHAHWILPQGLIGVFLKKLFKIPLIVTIHGSDLFPLKSNLFRKLHRFVAANANFITVGSEATKNELRIRIGSLGNVNVVPMGVDSKIFRKIKIKKPKKYSKNKILLFVGRLSDQKGLQYIIDAMPNIVIEEPSAKLLIIGEGPYKSELLKRINENKVNENVEFLGSLPSSEVAKYHNYADIFIFPSLSNKTGTEALGLALMEAMSSGCAVVGANVGGIPSLIKNGYNGILVRQKDSMELYKSIAALLKNKKKAEAMGKNAAAFIQKNYSWDKVSSRFIKIYENALK